MSRGMLSWRTYSVGVVAIGLLGAGCDHLPWEAKDEPAQATSEASTSPRGTTAATGGVSSVPPQEVVASVNQASIGTRDMNLAIEEIKRYMQSIQQTWQPLPAEDNPNALDLYDLMNNLIDSELKAQDARARGLGDQAEVKQRFAYLQRGFYAQEWDRWQRERAKPSEDEIHKFYEQNKVGFTDPERLHIRWIVATTLKEAEDLRGRAVQGEPFAELARQNSVGAGKDKGGDVGWFLRGVDKERLRLMGEAPKEEVFFPQLEPVAFSLEIGQVSMPVKGPDGRYYVALLEERKPNRQKTEVEVHDTIRDLLTLQNIQKQIETLREKNQVKRFPERLGNVQQK